MKILIVYDSTQTYTNTVFDHLRSFGMYSNHEVKYIDYRNLEDDNISLTNYHVLVHHYSVRLITNLPLKMLQKEQAFRGTKILFIQDEYDYVDQAVRVINYIGYDLIFTCVPAEYVDKVYQNVDKRKTNFIQVLTGYLPLHIPRKNEIVLPSRRKIHFGARGRKLPLKYGSLGLQKSELPLRVKEICKKESISHDIEIEEHHRLYGHKWERFLSTISISIGTPSGSNCFDFDGSIDLEILNLKTSGSSDKEIDNKLTERFYTEVKMNQISPRIFEAIANGNALLLLEDTYSNILTPEYHFLSVKDDYRDLEHKVELSRDLKQIDEIWKRSYSDIVESGKFSYETFIDKFDSCVKEISPDDYAFLQERNKNSSQSDNLVSDEVHRPIKMGIFDIILRSSYYLFAKILNIMKSHINR